MLCSGFEPGSHDGRRRQFHRTTYGGKLKLFVLALSFIIVPFSATVNTATCLFLPHKGVCFEVNISPTKS